MTTSRDSVFAECHPLTEFAFFTVALIVAMTSMHPVFLFLGFTAALSYHLWLRGRKGLKLVYGLAVPILIITSVINPLFNHRGVTVLFYLNGNAMTLEAILYGLAAGTMMMTVLLWFSCVQVIVSPDKFIYLFGRILPVLGLLLSMVFRFIPLLKSRYEQIREGQKGLGFTYSKGSPFKKMRQFVKEYSILIAWSLEAAIETSDSMEARGYGLRGRTSFHLFRFRRQDVLCLIIIGITGVLLIFGSIRGYGTIYYYPAIYYPYEIYHILAMGIVYVCLIWMPFIMDVKGELRWRRLSSEISASPIPAVKKEC